MLMSSRHKFIFIHIYKTAGTSVMGEFVPYARLVDRLAYEFWITRIAYWSINYLMGWHDDGMRQFTGLHKHAKAYEIEEKLGREAFDDYFRFSFVRNPFDFLVSLYFYVAQSKNHRMHASVSRQTFPEFVRSHLSGHPPCQTDFLMSRARDRRLVDYIGRFETLSEDVLAIKKALDLDVSGSVGHRNRSIHRALEDYRKYYDDESRALVTDYFGQDLELLGYGFDGFGEQMPIMRRY